MSNKDAGAAAAIFGPMRLPFLALVPACVLLGAAAAKPDAGSLSWTHLLLALLGGLAAHIGVNSLNEYDDFRSGLDMKTERTPFSGGSGTLPAQPHRHRFALITGLASLAVVLLVGLYFIRTWGWAIAPRVWPAWPWCSWSASTSSGPGVGPSRPSACSAS